VRERRADHGANSRGCCESLEAESSVRQNVSVRLLFGIQ
jgi:hypothetical protein